MKIKMHYMFGKKQEVVCGCKNVLVTTNYKEITCKRCLVTRVYRTVKAAFTLKNHYPFHDTQFEV